MLRTSKKLCGLLLAVAVPALLFLFTAFGGKNHGSPANADHSKVSVCSVGLFSTLQQPQVQMNLKSYVLEPLQADYFAHLDLEEHGAKEKDIFAPPPLMREDVSRFLHFLKPVQHAFISYASMPNDDDACTIPKTTHVHGKAWFPYFFHVRECFKMITAEEERRARPYTWVAFVQSDIKFYRLPATLTSTSLAGEFYASARFRKTNSSEVTGEFQIMKREVAPKFAGFTLVQPLFPCSRCDAIYASRHGVPECVLHYFLREFVSPSVTSIHEEFFVKERRCGTRTECLHAAHARGFRKGRQYYEAVGKLYALKEVKE